MSDDHVVVLLEDPELTLTVVDEPIVVSVADAVTSLVSTPPVEVLVLEEAVTRVVVEAGPPGPAGPQNHFIQATAPVTTEPTYAWWDTSAPSLTLWIEDGL